MDQLPPIDQLPMDQMPSMDDMQQRQAQVKTISIGIRNTCSLTHTYLLAICHGRAKT